MSKITDAVTDLAAPIAAKNDCELWDVEYVKEAGGWYLRVYIDHPDGISISQCEAVSRELDPILDEHEDLIPGSYIFEVSSAGAERRLRRPSDFERFIGHFVEVKLYKPVDGQKVFFGNLSGYNDGAVEIETEAQGHDAANKSRGFRQRRVFEKSEVANVRLRIR